MYMGIWKGTMRVGEVVLYTIYEQVVRIQYLYTDNNNISRTRYKSIWNIYYYIKFGGNKRLRSDIVAVSITRHRY